MGVDVIGQLTLCGMMWAVGSALFDLSPLGVVASAAVTAAAAANGTLATVATNLDASTAKLIATTGTP